MKLHERYFIVKEIELELSGLVLDFLIKHKDDITDGEELKILNEVFSSSIGSVARGMIRVERHGDTDKKGDEA